MVETPFTRLIGCTVPLQLAGMGPISSPELTAAVSEAGGLGLITLARAPLEVVEQRLEELQREADEQRAGDHDDRDR